MLSAETDTCDTVIEDIRIVNSNSMDQYLTDRQRYTGAIRKNSSPPESASSPQADHLPGNFKTVVDKINQGYRVCIITRGLPGSGKSFLAHQIIGATVKDLGDHIVSADNFFIDRNGKYRYDPSKITEAHSLAQNRFTQLASQGVSPLISDNTNLEYWNMYYYLQVAVQYGYHIEIMEPATPWKFAEQKLGIKNQHGVPADRIKVMKKKYETGASLENLLRTLNLDVVRQPKMRNIPPLVEATPKPVEVAREVPIARECDLIDFGDKPAASEFEWKLYEKKETLPKEESTESKAQPLWPLPPPLRWSPPPQFIEKIPERSTVKASEDPKPYDQSWQQQSTKKQRKKNRSPQAKLSPHRKNCPNENVSFAQIRELYPTVKDSYLWDFFERCKGDADWCVNLLCDENLTDQMEAGNDLTCTCFTVDSTKSIVAQVKETETPKQQQGTQSPTGKSKKAKAEATKKIDLDEWFKAKDELTQNIVFGDEHYPDHVKQVKNWKKTQPTPLSQIESIVNNEKIYTPQSSITPSDIDDELHELTIPEELVMELDEEYGGGLLKQLMDKKLKFPPKKIFIKKSTAHQLYLEVMEAYYSREEEARLQVLKDDEEFAKKLSEMETMPKLPHKVSKKSENMDFRDIEEKLANTWKSDDIAVKMSKEKLIELFPGVDKDSLMEIFASHNYNFNETVLLVQDSFNCTEKERKEIAQVQKKLFNTTWREQKSEEKEDEQIANGYTSEHLKTVENLRQQIQDHKEEQKVCINRSKEAFQKKDFEIASYLSNIASFHKQKAEEATHEVANMMAGIHEKTQGDDKNLDLHYLNLVEAAVSLDTFLDRNISRLRAIRKPYEELHIITGRGLHSVNGIATIKNQTKSRLRERNLTCTDPNPGLLRVKVFQKSKLSNEF